MQTETKNAQADRESLVFSITPLTCTSHGGGVFDIPVEAFVAVTDGGSLVMAGAMWRTLGAFSVPSVCFEEARLTCWGKREVEEEAGYTKLMFLMQFNFISTHTFNSKLQLLLSSPVV